MESLPPGNKIQPQTLNNWSTLFHTPKFPVKFRRSVNIQLGLFCDISPNSTWLDSTRSTCRAHAFWLCRASRRAQLDSLNTTSSTGSTGSTRRTRLARLARHVELEWLDWLDTSSSTGATCNLVMITVIHLLFNKLFTD